MTRYKIEIEYDGTNLLGWQFQKDGPSVQGVLQEALFKFTHKHIEVYGAGRTDAGVHAYSQTAHFDLETEMTPSKILMAMNALIRPNRVAVLNVEIVNDDFNARIDAIRRKYVYKILNRSADAVLDYNRVWWVPKPLNVEDMIIASKYLLGKHDFTSFRAAECQAKSPIKTLDSIEIIKDGDMIYSYFEARSFLHHQVRNIMGTLKMVGDGKMKPEDIKTILEAKDRKTAGPTAPASGLYMIGAFYK
ncbi:MAG: tRNA pseudouridine synthase A [Alphaproteobacteria bacterium ADurb.Bin438]|nr:MAG: tRNA pseudouridine synthase A [Alphaproteobacteria bacterium ADurb.Bin438]